VEKRYFLQLVISYLILYLHILINYSIYPYKIFYLIHFIKCSKNFFSVSCLKYKVKIYFMISIIMHLINISFKIYVIVNIIVLIHGFLKKIFILYNYRSIVKIYYFPQLSLNCNNLFHWTFVFFFKLLL